MVRGKRESSTPCHCVYRAIFKACFRKFIECATKEKCLSRVSFERSRGRENACSWSRKDEEYVADFCLVSKRVLTEDEHRVFRYYFLLGADWRLCCRKLEMDRGPFFHMVYRIQRKLGRTFRELKPYALYPLDEYFLGAVRGETMATRGLRLVGGGDQERPEPLRPPVKKAA